MTSLDFDSIGQVPEYAQPDYDSFCKAGPISQLNGEPPDSFVKASAPTEAQLKAGNYPKRKVPWNGMTISIENEAGSVRRGVDPNGKAWETKMLFAYGYLRMTMGVDGDSVDVYLGPVEDAPMVYVVHQRKAGDWGRYDEDKVLVNFSSEADAVDAFLRHYNDLRFLGPVTAMPVAEFVAKARATFDKPAMIKSLESGGFDFGQEMLAKSEHGPIPEGAHWITVNSGGGKGQPILVMPHSDGSMRVIGGAGGALNHLKLRSVKTGEGYKESIAAKQKERQEKQKAQTEADKASGIHGAKQEEKGKLKLEMKKQREEFVKTVSEAMGWTDTEFDESKMEGAGLSDEAILKAKREHAADLFKRAKDAVNVNRKMLLNDHDALAASGLGDMPLQAKADDVISVADLDPVSDKPSGLGFSADYGDRAAKQGLTPDVVEKELTAVHGAQKDPAKAEKTAAQKVEAENIGKELDAFKLSNPETHKPSVRVLEDATKAAALVLASKKLKMAEQLARHASMELASAKIVESKAYVLEVSDAEVEAGAKKQMEQDIKTIGAVGLLSEIDKMGGEESLGGHVGAGAFNSLNAFSTAVGGEPLIDRSVVDVLGINAAAQILARRIARDYQADDYEAIKQGVEDYHTGSQADKQDAAVSQAQALAKAASDIELPDGKDGFDLAHAQELNHRRREAVKDAKRILGQATGELQANAALVMAMRQGAKDKVEVSLGKTEAKAAITQLHALGLKSGDYKLDDVGGNLVATVTGEGLDRLAKPVDVEGLKQIKRNLAIIRGDMDEDGWLPQGFANRPDLAMHVEPGVAVKLAKPFQPGSDLAASLRDYVGGRVADGGALQDILADIQSSDFFAKAGDPAAYRAALDEVAPLKGAGGKMKPIDSLKESFEKMADDFVSSNYGPGTSALHRQNFEVDKKSVDALHRSLSATPEGVAAFKPIGDLTPQERTGLRKWWESNVGKKDAGADGLKADLADTEKNEPEKSSIDMFGEESINPDWHSWKAKRDDLAQQVNAAGLDWNKYVGIMGSPAKAISSTQDLVRSQVVSGFADAHNKLNPKSPLKVGKTTIQGGLNHLDAVDPEARAARQAKEKELIDSLRERINGKYASGSVSDKIEAQKEAQAAFEQAQMGFFSTDDGGDMFGPSDEPEKHETPKLGADERFSLGHAAEQKIAGMMSVVGQNFKPGKPTKLWNVSMSGEKFSPQQRAIKLMEANKRVVLGLGAGSGKTNVALGATAHLIKTGKIKRALHLVPSIVQDQYGAEASRSLEAGQFKWHCQPGASQAERIAGYKDASNHFNVVTHESFRADMLHMGAQHAGISEDAMNEQVAAMSQDDRKAWAKSVMEKEGMDFGATFVDEAHQMLNRAGKENSARANVIDAVTENTPYLANMSGDTVKNDSCLHPNSVIFDPVRSVSATVQDWACSGIGPFVYALDVDTSNVHVVEASIPFIKSENRPMFEVAVGNLIITVAADHRFLTPDGWMHLSDLSVGSEIAVSPSLPLTLPRQPSFPNQDSMRELSALPLPMPCSALGFLASDSSRHLSSFESFLEKTHARSSEPASFPYAQENAVYSPSLLLPQIASCEIPQTTSIRCDDGECDRHCLKAIQGYQGDCSTCHHQCDEQPLLGLVGGQEYSTSQACVRGFSLDGLHSGGSLPIHRRNHQEQHDGHLSNCDVLHPCLTQNASRASCCTGSSYECSNCALFRNSRRDHLPSVQGFCPAEPILQCQNDANQEALESPASSLSCHLSWNVLYNKITAIIKQDAADIYDLTVPIFHNYLAHGIWHHNSEIHSVLEKMDRSRYPDRAAFMRSYGGDTLAAKAGLKREMARYGISNTITPDVKADYQNITVPLSDHQKEAIGGIDKTMARLAAAKASGKVDVESAKALSPSSFEGVPDDQHEAIAKGIAESAGIMKESAVKRVINSSEKGNSKIDKMLELADKHKGQPGVVFAHNRAAVAQIIKALEAKGHKVTSITGGDSAKDKAKKRALFQPEAGDAKADIMVCSDAGAVGQNLQRGTWLCQHDVPDTAMAHGQRSARIHRLGQKNDVSVYTLASDHKSERTALRRLQKKYALREMMLDPMGGLDDTGIAGAISKRMLDKQQGSMF